MLSYCLKCKKNTKNINPKVSKTINGKTMILSKYVIFGSKNSKFIKEQQAKGLLSNLGIRTPLNKIPLLGHILFQLSRIMLDAISLYKIINIINKLLLAGDKFMLEIHLRQPQFTYSAWGPFTKHKQRIQKSKETGDTNYIYKNELDKACFAHDAAYSDSKNLTKRTIADKILRDKAFNIAKDPQCDGYQRGLASMVYTFFDKKSAGSGVETKLAPQNQQLAEELHKPINTKFEKREVYGAFKDNIWGGDLADMQLLSSYNKGIRFLLCVIDVFSKYAWVLPLKYKKGVSIVTAFQSILKQSNKKPNKIWVDKGSEFYNACFKKWLGDNDIVLHSTHNEGKSVVAERFIRTLKSKIYKYIISKNVYVDKLDDIVDKYNNTYHTTIKMKPIDVEDNTYINTDKETNDKDSKFKVGDHVKISKYKNIFAKGYTPNCSEEVFVIKKVKNIVPWTYVINDLNSEEIMGTFMKKNCKRQVKKNLELKK